ncbi:MAG: hypothetical protein KC410_16640, partial [Anaerolineales bacterium]|nr:hypothetical protein [Anaerolineales bacterium]
ISQSFQVASCPSPATWKDCATGDIHHSVSIHQRQERVIALALKRRALLVTISLADGRPYKPIGEKR